MTESAPTVADSKERQRALDPSDSFIVQAPAGSGKTELLTQRYLALLAQVESPEEVLAITFTNKAAGEMRSRILKALQRASSDPVPSSDHERQTWQLAHTALARDAEAGWALLDNPGRLRILTIDSLCAGLTRQMPLLSRMGATPAISNEPYQLYREAARQTLAEVESGEQWSAAIEHLLRHLDNNLPRVEALLASMLERRDQWLRHLAGSDGRLTRKRLEQALHEIIREHLSALHAMAGSWIDDGLMELAHYAAEQLQSSGRESAITQCAAAPGVPGGEVAHLPVWQGLAALLLTDAGKWRSKPDARVGFPPASQGKTDDEKAKLGEHKQAFVDRLAALQDTVGLRELLDGVRHLPPPVYSEEQWNILQALIELLPVAVAQLLLVFRSRRMVDFSEVSMAAVRALGEEDAPTDLALALDYRIRHILVDEFQDTSLSQYQLLSRLTHGWSAGDGRTLFVVGDPMQSIYRFREAEVALYLQSRREGLGTVALEPLTLSVNFRSQAGIVDWINERFQSVFPGQENLSTGAVCYAPSTAWHDVTDGAAVNLHPLFGDAVQEEAQRVVDLVQQARADNPGGSIAILVRARSHLLHILPALRQAGLAWQAIDIEHLGERQAVQDVLSLTRALVHLADRTAWLSVLRAPWCGMSLGDLETLVGQDANRILWSAMNDETCYARLSPEGRARLERMRTQFAEALRHRQRRSLRRSVEGLWLALGGPATIGSSTELEDCQTFFRLLDDLQAEGRGFSLSALVRNMESLFAGEDKQADGRLQVMTIHKAKGLEFDTVILPGLGRKAPPRTSELLAWTERTHGQHGSDLILAPIHASGDDRDPVFAWLRQLDHERERNESVRLLYVAATRARHRLHLLGQTAMREGKEGPEVSSPVASSLLTRLWPAVEQAYRQALAGRNEIAEVSGSLPGSYREVQGISRHASDWALPALPPEVQWTGGEVEPETPEQAVEFSWVGPSARHIGTVVHALLQFVAEEGTEAWPPARMDGLAGFVQGELLRLGVPQEELAKATIRVQHAIKASLTDTRGIWLFDTDHTEAQNEYALSGIDDGRLVNVVLDRSFVDANGVRWIIDYKTSSHSGGGLDEFLDREQERYAEQLERYARLVGQIDDRPIRLGLYFPLLGGWREWEPGRA